MDTNRTRDYGLRAGWIVLAFVCTALLVSCAPPSAVAPDATEAAVIEEIILSLAPTDTVEVPTDTEEPTPTPTDTPTPTVPSPTFSITPSRTPTNTIGPTSTPFPTATFTPDTGQRPTRTATATLRWLERRQTETLSPSLTFTASLTPTITQTPTPQEGLLQISRPGSMSKVISPFRMEAKVFPGDDGLVRIEIIGEDSRMITQLWLNNEANIGQHFWISQHVEFDITAVAELGRLVLSAHDIYDRTIALSSVDLFLLLLGETEIKPGADPLEPYIIWYPLEDEAVFGGVVWVGGLIRPVNDTPLIIELIDQQGNVVGQKQVEVPHPEGDHTHARFDVGVEYTVQGRTPVRLTLRQESDSRLPGTVALNSRLIILEP
jgi:hypothetical protein